jgi:hypothetical protein
MGKENEMKIMLKHSNLALAAIAFVTYLMLLSNNARGHCDTMDGPVVYDAKIALDKGDVTPALKWVKQDNEKEIRVAFDKTLTVRSMGPEAKEMADVYFFETLVRVHRAGEGFPYTGLKPAGAEIEAGIAESDKAFETGSVDNLVKIITADIEKGIKDHFALAKETNEHQNDSVDSGRRFVEAYVNFIHYVEKLHEDATANATHHFETNSGE